MHVLQNDWEIKWIALVEDKQNIQTVAEVKKGGAAKQRLTIWSVNQYSIRILPNR